MDNNITPLLRRVFLLSLGVFLILSGAAWIFSPYNGQVISSVGVDMPCEVAFDYLGNSDNARDWSSFADYMETISEGSVKDGEIGSKRSCFEYLDKSGIRWEEEVVERVEDEYRKLRCSNFKGLWVRTPVLATEQVYTTKDYGCELKFTLDFMYKPSLWDVAKMKFAAFQVKSIFNKNLANVKQELIKRRP